VQRDLLPLIEGTTVATNPASSSSAAPTRAPPIRPARARPARARRQCVEPGAAHPRRRAADRSVRRLDQLAGLRSARLGRCGWCAAAAAAPTARARSPARSSWKAPPRRSARLGGRPRLRQPRQHRRCFRRAGLALGRRLPHRLGAYARGDGFVPVVAEQRGPSTAPPPTSSQPLAARRRAARRRRRAAGKRPLFTTSASAAPPSATSDRRRDASLRLVGRRWAGRRSPTCRPATSTTASRASARRAPASPRRPSSITSPPPASARGSSGGRAGRGVELRLGADWRETEGETRSCSTSRTASARAGRVAGGAPARSAALPKRAGRGPFTLTGGGRIDRWRIEDGFLQERVLATGAALPTPPFADRSGWEPTGARRHRLAPRAGADAAHRRLSRLAAADAERALPPLPGRRRRHRRQCRAGAGAAARHRGGAGVAAPRPAARIGAHRLRQPAGGRDRQRDARPRPRHLSRRRLRRGGRRISPAAESRRDRVPRHRAGRPNSRSALALSGGYSFADAEVRASGAAAAARRPPARPDAAP
jgi:hypothetical protein